MREAYLTGGTDGFGDTDASETTLTVVPARTYTLSKVKVDKDGFVSAEYTLSENHVFSEFSTKRYQAAHPDLLKVMEHLAVHVCLLTDQVQQVLHNGDVVESKDFGPLFEDDSFYKCLEFSWAAIRCSGFTLTSGGVVLVAQKYLRSGRTLNLVTPFELLDPDPEKLTGLEYAYLPQLREALNRAQDEVKLYLDGKHDQSGEQLDLFADITKEVEKISGQQALKAVINMEMGMPEKLGYSVSTRVPGEEWVAAGKGRKNGKDAAAGND